MFREESPAEGEETSRIPILKASSLGTVVFAGVAVRKSAW
jgi:hypothetical protein